MKSVAALALAVTIATGNAATPSQIANPFNTNAITNAEVSPTNPPTTLEVKRARRVQTLKSLQRLSSQNLKTITDQFQEAQDKYDKLVEKLDKLDKDDKDRADLEKEIDKLKEKLKFLGALRDIFQRNFNFLVTQIGQVQRGGL